jgi:hypothetical protein
MLKFMVSHLALNNQVNRCNKFDILNLVIQYNKPLKGRC